MRIVDIEKAKSQFAKLIDAVSLGEEIMIEQAGKPAAMLVPVRERRRTPGAMKGNIRVADDFDAALPDALQAAVEGR